MTTTRPSNKGYVHSVDSFTAVDGPGVRYLVFMQGCPLRCVCCANPDTQAFAQGTLVSPADLVKDIRKVAPCIRGVTVSGGEPLMQPAFVADLFRRVRLTALTTCIDTSGQGSRSAWEQVLPHTDHALVCLKHIDPRCYSDLTGRGPLALRRALSFVEALEATRGRVRYDLRYLLIPDGVTDAPADLDAFASYARRTGKWGLDSVELLPYHELGRHKYMYFPTMPPAFRVPTEAEIQGVASRFRRAGLKVRV
jgi:pyruvate formate lyase activating enzyme